jgi:hypothetical protein
MTGGIAHEREFPGAAEDEADGALGWEHWRAKLGGSAAKYHIPGASVFGAF